MRRTTLWLALLSAPSLLQAQQQDSSASRAVEVDEIIVTSERAPGRASDAPAAVRTLSRTELERRAGTDLTTILRDVPGVQIDPVVGSGAGVVLQGLGSDRVLILLDGAPVAGRIGGEFDISRIAPSQLERVEIVEGPQSTLYGSTAIGGVVNLLTRRDAGRRVELGTQVGSFGQRDVRGRVSAPLGRLTGTVDLGRREVDLVPGTSRTTPGTAERWDGLARVGTALGAGSLDARFLGVIEEQAYQGASHGGATSHSFNDNWQYDALVSATLDARARTEIRLHGSIYNHRFISSPTESRDAGTPEWDRQRVLDAEVIRRGTIGMHRWIVGAKGEREWLESARIDGGERAGSNVAGFGSADWMLAPWLRSTTGLRVTTSDQWGTDVAPRVAFVAYAPAGVYLKAGGARGFRAPSFKELYTDFTNTQGFTYTVLGDPGLEPEYSWNASAEIGRTAAGSTMYVRGFRNWLRNFIETSLVDPATSTFQYQNVARARTAGLEAGGSLTRGIVSVSASHAWLDTEDESSGEPLLGRAAHMSRGAVTVTPGIASLTGELVHSSSVPLQRAASGTTYQAAYARINLSAGVTLFHDARLTLGVDNLADTRPEGAATFIGRRWFGGLSWGRSWC
ncbi:MAG TPA: TonB-dependent receptor, partial [Gemmatimonadales bacterium]|nr:TonB-dependent receptor [Gemmatimonadales bacterium]